jgi:hypothetical protein
MAKVKGAVPEYHVIARIRASDLAAWLNGNKDQWWTADGESHLMETLNFPCPGDELAEALQQYGEQQLEILRDIAAPANVPEVTASQFEEYANTKNRYEGRNFLLRWQGNDRLWLLTEDVPTSESYYDEKESDD